jgi:excinuclease UvrABC nuclease subunit
VESPKDGPTLAYTKIGPYNFTKALPLDEARPPKEPGVYLFKVDNTVKYIGAANNLQDRVNYGHPMAKRLFSEAGRDPDRLKVSWHESESRSAANTVETFLIQRFQGRTLNQQKTTEHWKTYKKNPENRY